jgi:tritrans,polycis-undecaprenyl-diphosphate synthase [geranylgeranyl-diphosphate specific]
MNLKSFLLDLLQARWYERVPILYAWYEHSIKQEVLRGSIPQHIAIIQDGNRRYAKKLGQSTEKGHMYGADTVERVLNWCDEIGVLQLTLYGFSTENFKRPEKEKKAIFSIMKEKSKQLRESERTHKLKLRIRTLGDMDMLPKDLKDEIAMTDSATATYDKFYLNLAVAYGGRQEIVDSAKKIARDVQNGTLSPDDVTEDLVGGYLYLDRTPNTDVDLIIRTGGDERTSNFLPWQASGNECAIYISAPYWPEFRKIDFLRAIRSYQIREKEHKVKLAVSIIKISRQNNGVNGGDLRESLSAALKIGSEEAQALIENPLVQKELMKPVKA